MKKNVTTVLLAIAVSLYGSLYAQQYKDNLLDDISGNVIKFNSYKLPAGEKMDVGRTQGSWISWQDVKTPIQGSWTSVKSYGSNGKALCEKHQVGHIYMYDNNGRPVSELSEHDGHVEKEFGYNHAGYLEIVTRYFKPSNLSMMDYFLLTDEAIDEMAANETKPYQKEVECQYLRNANGFIVQERIDENYVNEYSNYLTDQYGNWIRRDYHLTWPSEERGTEYRQITYSNGSTTTSFPEISLPEISLQQFGLLNNGRSITYTISTERPTLIVNAGFIQCTPCRKMLADSQINDFILSLYDSQRIDLVVVTYYEYDKAFVKGTPYERFWKGDLDSESIEKFPQQVPSFIIVKPDGSFKSKIGLDDDIIPFISNGIK